MRSTTSALYLNARSARSADLKSQPDKPPNGDLAARASENTPKQASEQGLDTICQDLRSIAARLEAISVQLRVLRSAAAAYPFDAMRECARRGESWQDALDGGDHA